MSNIKEIIKATLFVAGEGVEKSAFKEKLQISEKELKKYMANAVLSSDNNTVYHLIGTPYNFPNEIKTVQVYEIGQEEFERLQATTMLQNSKETIDLKREVDSLKDLVVQQNTLIQQLLEKLS